MPRTVPAPETLPPLQLGLFDTPAAQFTAPAAPVPAPGASTAASTAAAPGAAPAGAAAASAVAFRHPQAQRELRLGEHLVGYALRRSRRRSIGFAIDGEGLAVAAPRWVGVGEIESALREKAAWIVRKLFEQRERDRRLQAARVDWRDGATIPFLGETVIIVLDPRAGARDAGAVLNATADALPGVARLTLHVGLAHDAAPAQIRDAVQSWLQRQARRIFEARCNHFAPLLGVQWRRLALSSAQTRWGSASADGSLRLNWRLVHFGMPTIDYVVAHELAHLRHMDHGPKFWDVVRSVVPDVERARGVLRGEVLPKFE